MLRLFLIFFLNLKENLYQTDSKPETEINKMAPFIIKGALEKISGQRHSFHVDILTWYA